MLHTLMHWHARAPLRALLPALAALPLTTEAVAARSPGVGGPDLCPESARPRVHDDTRATRRDAERNRLFCHGFKR